MTNDQTDPFSESSIKMIIIINLPKGYRHDYFALSIETKLRPGVLSPEDDIALGNILRRTGRTAKRLAKLDAQTKQ